MFGLVLHDVARGGERCEALHVFRWISAERVSSRPEPQFILENDMNPFSVAGD